MTLHTRLFLSDLTHLDCAYFDAQSGLTGESWRVDAELGGSLAEDGMLCDFGIVKSRLKAALDADIDHRLLLTASQLDDLHQSGEAIELILRQGDGQHLRYRAPQQSLALLDMPALSEEALALELSRRMKAVLPDNISMLRLHLTPAHQADPYRYCHGLRQHQGNCQRMAHGHRSRLSIRVDGRSAPALEAQWRSRFNGCYIGAAGDLASSAGGRHVFAYRGSQGEFELDLPAARSYVLEAEPTVEHLSAHIARALQRELAGRHIECEAFEGIGKGAISEVHPE